MANIKGLVSISTIIACYHINGELCGDSCKGSNINAIEFENFKKLEGDDRNRVINFITKDSRLGVKDTDKVEKECIVFKNDNMISGSEIYIFLFKEEIYKAQTEEKLKNSIKQLDNKKLYLIVGAIISGPEVQILKTNEYNINKVNENGNKYKLELPNSGGGRKPTGTGMPGERDTSGMGGLGKGMSTTGCGFPSTSYPGGAHTTTNC